MIERAHRIRQASDGIDAYVGGRLKSRRCQMGISLQKLGETCGVSFQQIQKYENGSNRISASRLLLMAHALDVPASYFFEGAPVSGESPWDVSTEVPRGMEEQCNTSPRSITDAKTLSLMHQFSRIKDAGLREKLVDIVKALADAAEK